MQKTRLATVALGCALVGASLTATPASADYYRRGYYGGGYGGGYHHHNGGINSGAAAAIGVIGGLALGAALAQPSYAAPAYGYGYRPAPVYAAPPAYSYGYDAPPVYVPPPVYRRHRYAEGYGCRIVSRRQWDPYYGSYVVTRREVCPY